MNLNSDQRVFPNRLPLVFEVDATDLPRRPQTGSISKGSNDFASRWLGIGVTAYLVSHQNLVDQIDTNLKSWLRDFDFFVGDFCENHI